METSKNNFTAGVDALNSLENKGSLVIKNGIDSQDLTRIRKIALQTAQNMQPSGLNSSLGQPRLQPIEKNVSHLLNDAETIYNWLIKDL